MLSLFMPQRHRGGVEVEFHSLLTLALEGGECSTSRPNRFTPGVTVHSAHCIGGGVDPIVGLDTLETEKYLLLLGFEPQIIQPVAY
jgi:hypothetical protein